MEYNAEITHGVDNNNMGRSQKQTDLEQKEEKHHR